MRGLQGRVWGAGGLAEKVLIQGARTCRGAPSPGGSDLLSGITSPFLSLPGVPNPL